MATLIDTPRGVGGKIDRNQSKQDQTLQVLSNQNPQAADKAMDKLGYSYSTTPPAAQGSQAITSTSLTPQPSFNLTPPKQSTAAEGFAGYMGASATQLSQQRQQMQESKDDFLTSILKSDTETGLQDKLYAKQVDPAEAELNDINQQIIASQHAQQRELQALGSQGALTPAQMSAQSSAINRRYTYEQADLAVIQLSKQGKFDSAKRIADRAVTAMMERQKLMSEALRFNYEENRDLFNKDEQRTFEFMQGERERTLQNEEYRLRAEFDQKIKQSDPMYQANLTKTYAEIDKIRAESVGGGVKAQQKLQGQVRKAQTVISKVQEATNLISGAFGGLGRTGFIGGFAKYIPGSNAYVLDRTLETVKANLGFDALQEMRDNSPTGGALGQVAVQELNRLEAAVSALDTGLPADVLRQNLAEVQQHYTNWLNLRGYELAPDGQVIEITN